jgi:hypothetical protein
MEELLDRKKALGFMQKKAFLLKSFRRAYGNSRRNRNMLAVVFCLLFAALCPAQKMIFKSGFEPGTTLQPIPGNQIGPDGYVQAICGPDLVAGFSWPIPVHTPKGINGIHVVPCTDSDSHCRDPLVHHFENKLDLRFRHSGKASLYLNTFGYKEGGCCAQETLQSSGFVSPLTEVYVRYWMMIPAEAASQISGTKNYWRMLTENKSVGDFRMELMAVKGACSAGDCPVQGDTTLTTEMTIDARGQDSQFKCPYADPVSHAPLSGCDVYLNGPYQYMHINNLATRVPIGEWLEVEWYMKRSQGPDGRYFAAINGKTVGDWAGPTYGVNLDQIQDMYWINLYSNHFPASEWIDDLEIWDAPPCTTLPCGAATGSSSGYRGVVPPSISSSRAAVGAVGIPFRYQIQATNNPTSYSISWQELPRGLSLDGKTGVISGTPMKAGVSTVAIQAANPAGNGTQPLTIHIESSIQRPVPASMH